MNHLIDLSKLVSVLIIFAIFSCAVHLIDHKIFHNPMQDQDVVYGD